MKTRLLILTSLLLLNSYIYAQTIWNGPITTFSKPNNADWNLQANQDRITSNVWITRKTTQGIFNINQEFGYSSTSPEDTQWAFGTTSILGSLTFANWVVTIANNPPGMVGQDMVVHLITDDIYIDIKFTSWSQGSLAGGGFSYQRSTDSGLSTAEFSTQSFTITPNPNSSEIKLQFPEKIAEISVNVFNILGEMVYSNQTYSSPINIRSWEKGIYLVQVKSDHFINTKKFIKN